MVSLLKHRFPRFIKPGLIYLGIVFFVYLLLDKRFIFWGDELWSYFYAAKPFFRFLNEYFFVRADNHPPLYYILLSIIHKIFQVTPQSDIIFRIPSILFFLLTVWFINVKFLKNTTERAIFLVLITFAPYFILYSRMVRYYTMAALLLIIAYYYLRLWLDNKERSGRSMLILLLALLVWTDYPGFLYFMAVMSVELLLKKRWKDIGLIYGVLLIVALPLAIINMPDVALHAQLGYQTYAGLMKQFILGICFPFYYFLIGDYFELKTFFLLIPLIFYGIYVVVRSRDKTMICYFLGFILINAFFLTFMIKRYPVFSYARFILFACFLFYIMLSRHLAEKIKNRFWVVLLVLGINVVVITNYLGFRNFINPVYFIPADQLKNGFLLLQKKYPDLKIMKPEPYKEESYFGDKYFPGLVEADLNKQGYYLLLKSMRLGENLTDLNRYLTEYESKYQFKVEYLSGFDNINIRSKAILFRLHFMKIPYKYYWIVYKKS